MSKHLLFLSAAALLLLNASLARASLHELPFPEIQCRDEVRETLEQWHVNGDWKAQAVTTPGQPTYVASTETIGQWAQVQLTENATVAVALITDSTQKGVRWSLQPRVEIRSQASIGSSFDCIAKESSAEKAVFPRGSSGKQFTDKDLSSLISKNKNGLILLWSPGMDYSRRAVHAAQEAALRLKLPLDVVLDSEATLASATQVQKSERFPASALTRDHSLELYMRGGEVHFPAFFVYQNGALSKPVLPGLMTADGYVAYVQGRAK